MVKEFIFLITDQVCISNQATLELFSVVNLSLDLSMIQVTTTKPSMKSKRLCITLIDGLFAGGIGMKREWFMRERKKENRKVRKKESKKERK